MPTNKWNKNLLVIFKTYNLEVDVEQRGTSVLDLWTINVSAIIVQNDSWNCGPIGCKIIENIFADYKHDIPKYRDNAKKVRKMVIDNFRDLVTKFNLGRHKIMDEIDMTIDDVSDCNQFAPIGMENTFDTNKFTDNHTCMICMSNIDNTNKKVLPNCNHQYCYDCYQSNFINYQNNTTCVVCNDTVTTPNKKTPPSQNATVFCPKEVQSDVQSVATEIYMFEQLSQEVELSSITQQSVLEYPPTLSDTIKEERQQKKKESDELGLLRQQEQGIRMKKEFHKQINKNRSLGDIVTVQVDTRDRMSQNPLGVVGVVFGVSKNNRSTIKVVCESGILIKGGTKEPRWFPVGSYGVNGSTGIDSEFPLSIKLQQIREEIRNGIFIPKNYPKITIQYAQEKESGRAMGDKPLSNGCKCKNGKCTRMCGCRKRKLFCGPKCICVGSCTNCDLEFP
jgi:hypothetical protein